jgi:hypothetical protein
MEANKGTDSGDQPAYQSSTEIFEEAPTNSYLDIEVESHL